MSLVATSSHCIGWKTGKSRRVKNNFLVYAPDLPILDMPMLVDPDGIFVRRVDFNGHYEVTLSPRNDRKTEIKHGSDDVDWDFWHKDRANYVIHYVMTTLCYGYYVTFL